MTDLRKRLAELLVSASYHDDAWHFLRDPTLDRALEDAERYAWRRVNPHIAVDAFCGQFRYYNQLTNTSGEWCDDYDAAIDAARTKP